MEFVKYLLMFPVSMGNTDYRRSGKRGERMFRKLSLALAVSAALSPLGALALGLGDIVTRSSLNESFQADIELVSVEPGEIDSIRAILASPVDFARAGLDRPFLLTQLRFESLELDDGRNVIRITTRDPVREPFLDFLVEVNWPKGRLLKEFTVLLDPPVTMDRAPAPITPAVVTDIPALARPQPPVVPPSPPLPIEPEPEPEPPARSEPPPATFSAYTADGEYGPVRPGDTLWGIAEELAGSDASTEQMAMALFRANPGAFAGNDINKLQADAVLQVPGSAAVLSATRAQARADFRAAVAQKGAYRPADRLVLAKPSRPKESADAEGTRVPGGEIEQVKSDLMMVRETSESTRQETENLRSRIRELEAQLTDIQQLLALKSDQLAQLQASRMDGTAAVAETVPEAPEVADVGAGAMEETAEESVPEEAADDLQGMPLESPVDQQEVAVEVDGQEYPMEPDLGAEEAVEAEVEVAEPPMPEVQPPVAEVAPPPVAVEAPRVAAVAPDDASQPDKPGTEAKGLEALIQQVLSDQTYLAAGGGGLIVLLLLVWLLLRRRREAEEEFNESVMFNAGDAGAEDLDQPASERTKGSSTDGEGDTSFISDFSPSDIDALQEETGEVDPAAEADVYIAYGRYQQAENLIKQALEKAPGRLDLKAKLAEIHFTTRNAAAFTALAEELQAAGVPASDPSTWERVASMGSELAPDHELFQGAEPPSTMDAGASVMPELGDDDLLSDSDALINLDLDLDAGMSEPIEDSRAESSALDLPEDESIPMIDVASETAAPGGSGALDSPFPRSAAGADDMEEFSLNLDDLDALEDVDLSDLAEESEFDRGGRDDLSTPADESIASPFVDSERLQAEDDIPAISLDDLESDQGLGDVLGDSLDGSAQGGDRREEMETKLDLARAYIEMDDIGGAREILGEVLEDGDETQKAAAREVLDQIG
jgi:pilus assembly protein FimV